LLPEIKILIYIAFIVGLFFMKNLLFSFGIFILMAILLASIPMSSLIRGWIPITIFLFFTFFSNLFFQHGRILFQAGPLFVTEEGLTAALLRTIRIFCMIAGAKILTATTGIEPLISAFAQLLKPFERLGVPVKEFFSTMGLTMKSLPRLKEQVVREYRTTIQDGKITGFRNRAKVISSFLMPLFVKSIQSPETFLNEGEKSRNDNEQKLTLFETIKFSL
jgi:energy-coupling factor transport system permease protein